jgi:hypothetical protein
MTKRIALSRVFGVAACVLGGTMVLGSAAFAAPHVPGGGPKPKDCVSKPEYRHVKEGMKRSRVHRMIGTDGKRESFEHHGSHASELRVYEGCNNPDSVVTITFEKDRGGPYQVVNKTAIWVA